MQRQDMQSNELFTNEPLLPSPIPQKRRVPREAYPRIGGDRPPHFATACLHHGRLLSSPCSLQQLQHSRLVNRQRIVINVVERLGGYNGDTVGRNAQFT